MVGQILEWVNYASWWVYGLFEDDAAELKYIGITQNPQRRLQNHWDYHCRLLGERRRNYEIRGGSMGAPYSTWIRALETPPKMIILEGPFATKAEAEASERGWVEKTPHVYNAPVKRGKHHKRKPWVKRAAFRNPPGAVCSEDGCRDPVKARGLCRVHYQRMLRQEIRDHRRT